MTRDREEMRSPIKQPPLRQAGQSLREQREEFILNKVDGWAFAAGFSLAVALMEWWRVLTGFGPHPVFMTLIAVAVCGLAYWRISLARKPLRDMKLGMEGRNRRWPAP